MAINLIAIVIALVMIGAIRKLRYLIFETNQGSFLDITKPLSPIFNKAILAGSALLTAIWTFVDADIYFITWCIVYWPSLILLVLYFKRKKDS